MSTIDPEKLTQQLVEWLEIDSVTPGEREYLEHLERFFTDLGYTCSRQEVSQDRWNLLALKDPNPRLLYSTHVDTVPPFLPVRVEDGTIYGRGACDTKGGLLSMAHAAERLGSDDVGFLLVVGEEVDHIGAKFSEKIGLNPERIILCEPTINRVVQAQKGMIKVTFEAEGIAAHSAYPDRGESAVHKLIAATHEILAAQWPDNEILGPTTINIGQISGGVAANVFAPSADALVLIRTVAPTADYLEQLEALTSKHGVRATVMVENDPVFFEPPEGAQTCTVSFNTDATYLSRIAPVWLVGPGDIEVAHTDHEHIELQSMLDGIDLYERLGRAALGE